MEKFIFLETLLETDVCKKEERLSMVCEDIESYSINNSIQYKHNIKEKPLKIDGIYVFIYISILPEGTYDYSFETSNIILVKCKNKYRQSVVFESKPFYNIRKLFEEMMHVIDTYVFTCYRFISPAEKVNYKIRDSNIEDCCSVCFETTYYHTLCNHPLCFKCREKCIEYNNLYCPICRQENVRLFKDKKRLVDTFYYRGNNDTVDVYMLDDIVDVDIVDIDIDVDNGDGDIYMGDDDDDGDSNIDMGDIIDIE